MTADGFGPFLAGNTMDRPLLVSTLISYASRSHADTDVVAVDSAGITTRSNWGLVGERSRRVSAGLTADGVRPGDRVATIAWNDHRHLEAYYGITGIGAVLHTVNPRLHDDQIAYILNDAGRFGGVRRSVIRRVGQSRRPPGTECAQVDRARPERCRRRSPGRIRVRGLAGRPSGGRRMARLRRTLRGDAVLHVRHYRQPQRRAAEPPFDRAADLGLLHWRWP